MTETGVGTARQAAHVTTIASRRKIAALPRLINIIVFTNILRPPLSQPELAPRYVPSSRLENLYPPRPNAFQKRRGLFCIERGGVNLLKDWTRLYLFVQLRETNSVPAFRVRDRGLVAWYGYGGVLIWRNAESFEQNPVKVGAAESQTVRGGYPGSGGRATGNWFGRVRSRDR